MAKHSDPVAMLCAEHREAEELIGRLEHSKSPGPRRREIVDRLRAALVVHMEAEEKVFYPAVAGVVGSSQVEEANTEHDLLRDGLRRLEELLEEDGFGAAVGMLKAGMQHHVEEEEQEMFPTVRHQLGDERLAEVAADMRRLQDASKTP